MRPGLIAFYRANERRIIGAGSLALFLALWEIISRTFADPQFISSPVRVLRTGTTLLQSGEIWTDLKTSGIEFLLGYVGAAVVAIPVGLAIGWSKRLQYIFGPFIDTLNAVPRITLLPLLIIWFGIGIWSKVVVV